MTVTGMVNMTRQWHTLNEATQQNIKMEAEIEEMKIRNEEIVKQIEYASDSANLEEKIRQDLALGKSNDSWININKTDNLNLNSETEKIKPIPKIREWINLFTR